MMDLSAAYNDPENKVDHLPIKVVCDFQDYLEQEGVTDLYYDVNTFMDTTSYSARTKNVYRNRLRRFLENVGLL